MPRFLFYDREIAILFRADYPNTCIWRDGTQMVVAADIGPHDHRSPSRCDYSCRRVNERLLAKFAKNNLYIGAGLDTPAGYVKTELRRRSRASCVFGRTLSTRDRQHSIHEL